MIFRRFSFGVAVLCLLQASRTASQSEIIALQVGESRNFSLQFSNGPAIFTYLFNKTDGGQVAREVARYMFGEHIVLCFTPCLNTLELIFHHASYSSNFFFLSQSPALRLVIASENASTSHPLLVTARQSRGVSSWIIPYIESG